MSPSFQIRPLSHDLFTELASLSEADLEERGARWVTADATHGYPCRVSLEDAEVGERVLLLPFAFHDADSPYRASGPIYVRPGKAPAEVLPNEVPALLATRELSLRAYDESGTLIGATLTPGTTVRDALRRLISEAEPDYVQIHNAATGCFFCTASC